MSKHYVIGDIHGEYQTLLALVAKLPKEANLIVEKYWLFKDRDPAYFAFHAMNNRYEPSSMSPIFNIFGHVPRDEVIFGENFISLDTGCGRGADRSLSAYCVETKEVLSVVTH